MAFLHHGIFREMSWHANHVSTSLAFLQHIVQRGNVRQPCFADENDYLRYLQELGEAATRHACALHACVLMSNHVHLLVTPSAIGAVSRMMQAIGRRCVGGFNARYRRIGTLREGHFKAALAGNARYVLTCYRTIELNPVRASMVASPGLSALAHPLTRVL